MARRKKRTATSTSAPAKPKRQPTTLGTLGDALRGAAAPSSRPAPTAAPVTPTRNTVEPSPQVPAANVRVLSEAELMAEAFAASGEADLSAKFRGAGYDPGDVQIVGAAEEPEPEPSQTALADAGLTGDDLLFAELMANAVDPLEDRDKYAVIRDHQWVGIRWHDELQLTSMSAEELREPTLTGEQRDLLRRARRAANMPVVNIRHYRRKEALGEVEAFVRACVQKEHRFARVVHGKGKQSSGEAVLKPAVVNWCQGVGTTFVRAWAPETDVSGQFGSLVMELRRP
jgi:hypothetical protein